MLNEANRSGNTMHAQFSWKTGNNLNRTSCEHELRYETSGFNIARNRQSVRLMPQSRQLQASGGRIKNDGKLLDKQNEPKCEYGWWSYVTQRVFRNQTSKNFAQRAEDFRENSQRTELNISHNKIIKSESIKSPGQTTTPRRSRVVRRSFSVPADMMNTRHSLLRRSISTQDALQIRQQVRVLRNGLLYTPEERTIEQTKDFCRDYVCFKLKCNNLLSRVKINRSPSCDHWLMKEIYYIGGEFERRNQGLCKNLSKQIGITLRSEDVLRKVFFEFSREIIITGIKKERNTSGGGQVNNENPIPPNEPERNESTDRVLEITWGRIIAIFVAAGGFASDCVTQGHSELVNELIEYCGEFFSEEGVVDWILSQGGWEKLKHINACTIRETDTMTTYNIIIITVCVIILLVVGMGIRNFTAITA